jgi:hypothetical protein
VARRSKPTDWRPVFLQALNDTGLVKEACRVAGIHRSTAYEERQRNEEFAVAWHDVEEETTERMEREAIRRAAEGVEKPVFQGGQQVGAIREYSDTLLIFMLKARRPERYRENVHVEHSGNVTIADLASLAQTEQD